jgi:cytoskeletal protein CcmA (bactofilin family)
MFELGKRDGDSGHSATGQSPAGHSTGATSTRSGAGQGAIIGRSIQINGDVKGGEDLLIEGDVSGTVELKNNSLTIGKEGKVRADIYARSITVEGTTEGDLFASERIAIRSNANVRGNLLAPRISLEDGARFKGSIEMDPQAVEKALGTAQSQTKSSTASDSVATKANGSAKPAHAHAGAASVSG